MTILVVEDDADQLAIRAMLFRQHGFKVLEAATCFRAKQLMEQRGIGCAVVDLRLPTEREGLQLLADFKRFNPSLPVFMLTGAAAGQSQLKNADAVFDKGTSIAALIKKLKAVRASMRPRVSDSVGSQDEIDDNAGDGDV